MLHNNCLHFTISLICLLIVAEATKNAHSKAKVVGDIDTFELHNEGDKYLMALQIAHHNMKLKPKIGVCRSWIKQALCKKCDRDGQQCQSNSTCFSSVKDPRISCDTTFCSKTGDYENSQRGIFGVDTQLFCTTGDGEQVLMPIVLANKINQISEVMGEVCLMDSQSSFIQGLLQRKGKAMQVVNVKKNPGEAKQMRDYSFESKETVLLQQLSPFGKGMRIRITNSLQEQHKQISILKDNGFKLELSLDQLAVSVPLSYFRQMEREILFEYFRENNCKFESGKIKCKNQLSFGGITEAIIAFQFQDGFSFSFPLHMLFGSCGSKQCNFLLASHNQSDIIRIGTIIWDAIALEWNLEEKKMWIHRLNNHWAAPFKADKMDFRHKSFLQNMLTFLWHIFLYIIYLVLGLALVSLLINFAFKWSEFLRFIRGILMRIRRRKEKSLQQTEREDDFGVGGFFDDSDHKEGRRMHRLPDDLQDQL